MKALRVLCLVLVAGLAAATGAHAKDGCKTNSTTSTAGSVVGGFLGGLASNALSKHGISNTYGATDAVTASLSSAIACSLSPQERKQADTAQTQALQSGKIGTASKTSWSSTENDNVNGGTVIESRNVDASGRNCAVTNTFITDVNGQEKSVQRKMCQNTSGQWIVAS